jgi:hypothetical protein
MRVRDSIKVRIKLAGEVTRCSKENDITNAERVEIRLILSKCCGEQPLPDPPVLSDLCLRITQCEWYAIHKQGRIVKGHKQRCRVLEVIRYFVCHPIHTRFAIRRWIATVTANASCHEHREIVSA